ncbi:hypothetical protein MNBD_ALPHA12-869 [hydrothermal vent metagenome]|uniref:YCII-related domain-containing protein n=1 Tax=hydrothermal vent metagenome TaxID=652676 RepID=A0A3B0UBS7_9ZZZZ
MTRWIAIITNNQEIGALREKHMKAHMGFLESHPEITMAGSTTANGAIASNGGVWVIKGVSYAQAVKICEDDPFFKVGMRQNINVFEYRVAPWFEELV